MSGRKQWELCVSIFREYRELYVRTIYVRTIYSSPVIERKQMIPEDKNKIIAI